MATSRECVGHRGALAAGVVISYDLHPGRVEKSEVRVARVLGAHAEGQGDSGAHSNLLVHRVLIRAIRTPDLVGWQSLGRNCINLRTRSKPC